MACSTMADSIAVPTARGEMTAATPQRDPSPAPDRLRRLLCAPRLPLWLAALAALLTLPALAIGWNLDDWVHQALIQRKLPELMGSQPLMDMFRFMDGDAAHNATLRDLGVLSWWAPDTLRASFWRPLTVLTHLLDDAIMPGAAWLAHATSIAWGAALVAVAALLYRRLHGLTVVAGLAALLYAVDDARSFPVAWVANRSALLATLFGLLAIMAHHSWRRDGWRPGAWLAPLLLATGLLAAEAALAATAYLFAYALFLDKGSLRDRLLCLTPHAATVIGWRLLYDALGYGAAGSGLYLDPGREPLRYAAAAIERLPVLLASQWSNVPSFLFTFASRPVALAWLLAAVVGLAALVWLLRDLLRHSPTARFYALGMLLAALPACATFPDNRLLLFVGFGGAGLLAEWLQRLGTLSAGPTPRSGRRLLGRSLIALHLLISPLSLVVGIAALPAFSESIFHACARALPDDAMLSEETVIFVNSNDICTSEVHFIRALDGQSRPHRVRLLTSALYDIEVTGVDQHAIDVRPEGGWHSSPADSLLRGADDPLPVGHHVALAGLDIEILAHNSAGLVSAARFRFELPLRHPSMRWIATKDFVPVPFLPPAPGETLRLARHF